MKFKMCKLTIFTGHDYKRKGLMQELQRIRSALAGGNNDLFKSLIAKHPKWISSPITEDGNYLLHDAIRNGNTQIVDFLLQKGASVECKSIDGFRPIHIAAYRGHIKIIKLLLVYDANVNSRTGAGQDACFLAVEQGFLETFSFLRARSAHVLTKNWIKEDNVIYLAIQKGDISSFVKILPLLIYQNQLSDMTLFQIFNKIVETGFIDMLDCLIQRANIFESLIKLDIQRLNANLSVKAYLKLLLHMLSIPKCSDMRVYPLDLISECIQEHFPAQFAILRLLIIHPELDDQARIVMTQLINKSDEANFLAEWFRRYSSDTRKDLQRVMASFKAVGLDKPQAFLNLIKEDDIHSINILLQDHNMLAFIQNNKNQQALLFLAAKFNAFNCFSYFVETHFFWPLQFCFDKNGDTIIHAAIRTGNDTILRFLLKNGYINLELQNKNGDSLLQLAARVAEPVCIKLLLQEGANSEILDSNQNTIWDLITNINPDLSRLLKKWYSRIPSYFAPQRPKIDTLVFQGGGVKGIAYYNALLTLINKKAVNFQDINIVAGTSAGAITAMLLAIGYSVEELGDILTKLDFYNLLDFELREEFFELKKSLFSNQELELEKYLGKSLYKFSRKIKELWDTGRLSSSEVRLLFATLIKNYLHDLVSNGIDGTKILNWPVISIIAKLILSTGLEKIIDWLFKILFSIKGVTENEYPGMLNEAKILFEKLKPLLESLVQNQGIFSGENLRNQFNKWIDNKKLDSNLTFLDLHQKTIEDPMFKDLYVAAYSIQKQSIQVFSHQTTPDVIIADAVRCSMSIHGFFYPHYYYAKKDNDRQRIDEMGQFFDGGSLSNYILDYFDKIKFLPEQSSIYQVNIEDKRTNPHVIGLRLVDQKLFELYEGKSSIFEANPVKNEASRIGLAEFLASILFSLSSFTKQESTFLLNLDEQARTIFINTGDISAIDFELGEKEQTTLLNSGTIGANLFVNRHRQWLQEHAGYDALISNYNLQREKRLIFFMALLKQSTKEYFKELLFNYKQSLSVIRDIQGNTLLHLAVIDGDVEAIEKLLFIVKTVNLYNSLGLTVPDMMKQCKTPEKHEKIRNFFIAKGVILEEQHFADRYDKTKKENHSHLSSSTFMDKEPKEKLSKFQKNGLCLFDSEKQSVEVEGANDRIDRPLSKL